MIMKNNQTNLSTLAATGTALDLLVAEVRGEVTITRLPRKEARRPRKYAAAAAR